MKLMRTPFPTSVRASCVAALVLGLSLHAARARAQEDTREGPLVNAPAIRGRLELRDKRFEIGAGLGSTLGAPYYHAVLANLKLGYHFNDWLAVTALVGQNLTSDFSTGATDELERTLPVMADPNDRGRTPTRAEALGGMNKIAQVLAAQAEVAPITGKFSMFGKLFFAYDFYVFGGLGGINYTASKDACTKGMERRGESCPYVGFKAPAWTFGGGMHAFVNELIAINLEVRDFFLRNNPSGRDVNADGFVTDADLTWGHNLVMTVNAQFFLPRQARRSD